MYYIYGFNSKEFQTEKERVKSKVHDKQVTLCMYSNQKMLMNTHTYTINCSMLLIIYVFAVECGRGKRLKRLICVLSNETQQNDITTEIVFSLLPLVNCFFDS